MKTFKVTLGLGRMASHHTRTFTITGEDENWAVESARFKFHKEVGDEIGRDAPIWGKFLTVSEVEEVTHAL